MIQGIMGHTERRKMISYKREGLDMLADCSIISPDEW
jgi:hypothetical protein